MGTHKWAAGNFVVCNQTWCAQVNARSAVNKLYLNHLPHVAQQGLSASCILVVIYSISQQKCCEPAQWIRMSCQTAGAELLRLPFSLRLWLKRPWRPNSTMFTSKENFRNSHCSDVLWASTENIAIIECTLAFKWCNQTELEALLHFPSHALWHSSFAPEQNNK